jgi:BirA family biotin operon repressor/biotin-[acetyl-CoA-carboxylase] ligase
MFSTVLRPGLGASQLALICLGAAVAVCRASTVPLRVKWPNDILDARCAKLGGILTEAEFHSGKLQYLVVGIGLNVEASPPSVPDTTCLRELGFKVEDTLELAFRVVDELLRMTDILERDPSKVLDLWRSYAINLGAEVIVGDIRGIAIDIGEDGALLVREPSGKLSRILAGDVQMVSSVRGRS